GSMRRIVGWPQDAGLDALERRDLAALLVTEADAQRVLVAMRALDEQREVLEPIALEDVCLRRSDGSPRWTYIMVSRLFPDRQFPRVTLCVDTTERKLAEEGLRRSRDMLTRTQELAKVGGWEFDNINPQFVCSDELRVIFEVPLDASITYDTLLSFFSAEQQAMIHEQGV